MSNRTCAHPLLVPELGVYKDQGNLVSSSVHSSGLHRTIPQVSLLSSTIFIYTSFLWRTVTEVLSTSINLGNLTQLAWSGLSSCCIDLFLYTG